MECVGSIGVGGETIVAGGRSRDSEGGFAAVELDEPERGEGLEGDSAISFPRSRWLDDSTRSGGMTKEARPCTM